MSHSQSMLWIRTHMVHLGLFTLTPRTLWLGRWRFREGSCCRSPGLCQNPHRSLCGSENRTMKNRAYRTMVCLCLFLWGLYLCSSCSCSWTRAALSWRRRRGRRSPRPGWWRNRCWSKKPPPDCHNRYLRVGVRQTSTTVHPLSDTTVWKIIFTLWNYRSEADWMERLLIEC